MDDRWKGIKIMPVHQWIAAWSQINWRLYLLLRFDSTASTSRLYVTFHRSCSVGTSRAPTPQCFRTSCRHSVPNSNSSSEIWNYGQNMKPWFGTTKCSFRHCRDTLEGGKSHLGVGRGQSVHTESLRGLAVGVEASLKALFEVTFQIRLHHCRHQRFSRSRRTHSHCLFDQITYKAARHERPHCIVNYNHFQIAFWKQNKLGWALRFTLC